MKVLHYMNFITNFDMTNCDRLGNLLQLKSKLGKGNRGYDK
jgi:hypothetical protein